MAAAIGAIGSLLRLLVTRKNKELERRMLGPLANRQTLIWFVCAASVLAGVVIVGIEIALLVQVIGWLASR